VVFAFNPAHHPKESSTSGENRPDRVIVDSGDMTEPISALRNSFPMKSWSEMAWQRVE
jgi:hypothetical protein